MRHSLATAAAAEAPAIGARPSMASEGFIAGLLLNLGVALQVQLDPQGIEAMVAANRGGSAEEIRILESSYAMVGHEKCLAVLFEAWKMPESLVSVAAYHRAPTSASELRRDVTTLVNLGVTDKQLDVVASRSPARIKELESALFDVGRVVEPGRRGDYPLRWAGRSRVSSGRRPKPYQSIAINASI